MAYQISAQRTISSIRSARRWVGGAQHAALPVALVGVIVLLFLPLTPAYDVHVFLRAGYAALHSLPVYPVPGSAAVYSGAAFVYPYFAAWLFAPLAALPVALGTAVFFAVTATAVLGACMCGARSGPWRAGLVLASAFTITGLQLGAISPLLFVGAVFLWRLRERPIALALLGAPVLASKLFLLPLLAWLLLARRYRALAWACALTLGVLGAGFLFGPLAPGQYLRLLAELGTHEAGAGFGLAGTLMKAGMAPLPAQALALGAALGVLGAAAVRHRRSGDERLLFTGAILASLLLTPVLWSHYLVLLPAALLLYEVSPRWFLVLALASWAVAPPHGVPQPGAIEAGAAAGTLALVLCLGAPLVLARRAGSRSQAGTRLGGAAEPARAG